MATSRSDRDRAEGNLIPLDELKGYRIAKGEPDPRGWKVVASDGRRVGEVEQLVMDYDTKRLRYLDCELAEERLGLEKHGRHVLIPLDDATLAEDDKLVLLRTATADDVLKNPTYIGDFRREYLEGKRGGAGEAGHGGGQGAERPPSGSRELESAGEPRERERQGQQQGGSAGPARPDESRREYSIPVMEERLVMEKRPVVKEGVVVRRRPTQDAVGVEDELEDERRC